MAIETLVPNGDDAAWDSGGWDDINEGVPGDDDTTKVVETTKSITMIFDLVNSALEDADTINSVTIDARLRCDLASGDSVFRFDLLIGGTPQGFTDQVPTSSWATYTGITNAAWDSDWTAAELDGMQISITSRQTGMPTADLWEVTALDVVIDYTAAAGGQLHTIKQNLNGLGVGGPFYNNQIG